MECFLAHIRRDQAGEDEAVQTAKAHCRKTAEYAGRTMEMAGLSAAGYLAGLVHDAGKYTSQFQMYLRDGEGRRGSVNHTFAGVRLLLERFFTEDGFSVNFWPWRPAVITACSTAWTAKGKAAFATGSPGPIPVMRRQWRISPVSVLARGNWTTCSKKLVAS